MFTLYRFGSDEFMFVVDGEGAKTGTKRYIAMLMHTVGIRWEDIEDSIVDLEVKGHQLAKFGIHGGFLYSVKLDSAA